jgi:hypothetical protein
MGAQVLDWLINGLDSIEKGVWPWANADVSGACGAEWASGGFLTSPTTAITSWLSGFFGCIWEGIKFGLGQIAYQLAHGAKALICMLRAGQARPGSLDYTTYAELWALRYAWKYVKTLRLSSPDFLGLQTIGMDVEDFFDRILEHLLKSLQTMEVPGPPEAIEAYLKFTIGEVQFRCWMQLNDVDPDVWGPVIQSRREQLTTDEKLDWIRRASLGFYGKSPVEAGITATEQTQEDAWRAQAQTDLRSSGWLTTQEVDNRYNLHDEVPTISDHLHWLARNVDDLRYVADYHLLDGFDSPAVVQGMLSQVTAAYQPIPLERNFWAEFGTELRAQGMRKIDAARHYAAHWLHGSPQQLREFVFRLRPDRPFSEQDKVNKAYLQSLGYSPEIIDRAQSFTADDFRRILAEQDYGYLDVAWFLGTLYHVPALSYIRDMYRYGIIDETALKGYHQDLGYTELDSERFVGVDRSIKARVRSAESFGWTPGALSRAFGLGLVDAGFYADNMKGMGFSDAEISSAQDRAGKLAKERVLTRSLGRVITRVITQISASFGAGVLDRTAATAALTNLGITDSQSQSILDMEVLKTRTKLVAELVRTIRGAFVKGKVNEDAARTLLVSANVQGSYIDALISTWTAEQMRADKPATLAQIKDWVLKGLMTVQEAQIRLDNLKIPQADQQLILAELQQRIAALQQVQAVKAAKQVDRENLAIERAAKQAAQAAHAAIEQLMREEPPAKLAAWLQQRIIGEGAFRGRLGQYGFDQPAIDEWVAAARAKARAPLLP